MSNKLTDYRTNPFYRKYININGKRFGFLQFGINEVFFFFIPNNDTIRDAVDTWVKRRSDAIREYGHISTWDTSLVTDMSCLFKNCKFFDDDISSWDTSNVTNMYKMFYSCKFFNQPIGGWNVSKVTNMNEMFAYAYNFNQPLNNWNVSHVTDMNNIFSNAFKFKQPLDNWKVSQVKNIYTIFGHNINYRKKLNIYLKKWGLPLVELEEE